MEPLEEKESSVHAPRNIQMVQHGDGCGLVRPDDGRRGLFFHRMGIVSGKAESLDKGDEVSYEVAQQRNGQRVTNVYKRCRYSWPEDCRERVEDKEVRHDYYVALEEEPRGEAYREFAPRSRWLPTGISSTPCFSIIETPGT
jgi:cold shock CspA family protein